MRAALTHAPPSDNAPITSCVRVCVQGFGDFGSGGNAAGLEGAPQTMVEEGVNTATLAQPDAALLTSAAFEGDAQALKLAASQVLMNALPAPLPCSSSGIGTGTGQTLSQSSCRLDQLICAPAQDPALPAWQTSTWLVQQPSPQSCAWDGSLLEKGFLDALGLPLDAAPVANDARESPVMGSAGNERCATGAAGSSITAGSGSLAPPVAAPHGVGADDGFAGFGDFSSPVATPAPLASSDAFAAIAGVSTDPPAGGGPPLPSNTTDTFGSFAGGSETASSLSPPAPADDLMGLFGSATAGGTAAPVVSDSFGGFSDSFAGAPQVSGPPAAAPGAGLLDLGFFGDAQSVKPADSGGASLLNSTMAQMGMADMLASLESLEGPTAEVGGIERSVADAWLSSLPDLSWVFSTELQRPTAAVH